MDVACFRRRRADEVNGVLNKQTCPSETKRESLMHFPVARTHTVYRFQGLCSTLEWACVCAPEISKENKHTKVFESVIIVNDTELNKIYIMMVFGK